MLRKGAESRWAGIQGMKGSSCRVGLERVPERPSASFCVALLLGTSDELPSVADAAGGNISDRSCVYTPIAYTVMSLCGAVRGVRMLPEERALQQSLPQGGFP